MKPKNDEEKYPQKYRFQAPKPPKMKSKIQKILSQKIIEKYVQKRRKWRTGTPGSRPRHTKGGDCCQCCEQRCITLVCHCKRPCCVVEPLRIEVAHEPLCSLHKCCRKYVEQLIAPTMCCSIGYVGKFSRSKFARARHLQGVLYQQFHSTTPQRSQAKFKWLVLNQNWLEPKWLREIQIGSS